MIMRLFVAIEIDDEIKNRIVEAINRFRNNDFDIKLVEPKNLHLTVKFLGEVGEDRLHDIENNISDVVKSFKPFRISLENMGYFGNPDYIRVVWIDTIEGRETITKLIHEVNGKLKHIRREEHEPSPHLTIGRVKSGRNREKLIHEIQKMSHVKFGEMNVKLVKLKLSELTKQGPIYRDVKLFHLGE